MINTCMKGSVDFRLLTVGEFGPNLVVTFFYYNILSNPDWNMEIQYSYIIGGY